LLQKNQSLNLDKIIELCCKKTHLNCRKIITSLCFIETRNKNILDNQALAEIAKEEMERQREMNRAKTAPNSRDKRRNWNVESSLEIKTTSGGKKVRAPGTGS